MLVCPVYAAGLNGLSTRAASEVADVRSAAETLGIRFEHWTLAGWLGGDGGEDFGLAVLEDLVGDVRV